MGRQAQRSMYLDALRSLALFRVVIYHATAMWTLTAFTAMPLMFIVAGSLFAASLERRPAKQVIVDRYRRILLPYWVYVLALVVLWASIGIIGEVNPLAWISFAMPVLSPGGPQGPPGQINEMTWIALWYLQMHLILSLIGPWLRTMHLRHGKRYWIALVAVAVLMFPLGIGLGIWAVCWSIGYLQHDGVLQDWFRPRWVPIVVIAGPLGAGLFFVFHTANEGLAGLGSLLLGVFWVTLATAMRDRIEPWLQGRRMRAFLYWSSARSLTIYLWHLMLIYGVEALALPGSGNPFTRVVWTLAALPVPVTLFGWVEDLAAKRGARLWPLPPSVDARPQGTRPRGTGPAQSVPNTGPAQRVPNTRSPASPKPGTM